MLNKFGILVAILVMVLLFYLVISLGAGSFSKKEKKPEVKRYVKSVNILLGIITIVGMILILFM
tara:strand:- start:1045 stop:1236 length:192 start_codon:yes stop_codon:yes gene_type:complete